MISSALILMVAGMLFVMMFLTIQVLVTKLSANVSSKFAHLLPEPTKVSKKPAAVANAADDGEAVAAIVIALKARS